MVLYLILAQSAITARAFREATKQLKPSYVLEPTQAKEIVCSPEAIERDGSGVGLFGMCAAELERAYSTQQSSQGITVLVDAVQPARLTAVSESASWEHLVAMLILAFPEVRWVFGVIESNVEGFPAKAHSLASLAWDGNSDPLLDPTGIREWVRNRTRDTLSRIDSGSSALPARTSRAASIDEEPSYAYYHAYAAYRYGFRVDVVTSWNVMKQLFCDPPAGKPDHTLLLEDMRINFPDKPLAVHLSKLEERGRHCPGLSMAEDRSQWRFLITTGQTRAEENLIDRNREYLKKKNNGRGSLLLKPVGGLLDLWEHTELAQELGGAGRRPGNADGFDWPTSLAQAEELGGHGAPGKLMLIAGKLLERAESGRDDCSSVVNAIRGAVHATDAIELLSGKTPTTTLGGIVLRHELEVRAECSFTGAGYHIGTRRRLRELDGEIGSATLWFDSSVRRKAGLDARVSALSRLVLAFRDAGKLEEETECLVELRKSNRRLTRPLKWYQVFHWATHFFLCYAEWLLARFDRLIWMSGIWVVLIAMLTWRLAPSGGFASALDNAVGWFISATPNGGSLSLLTLLSWIAVILGIFHIGVLISFLYSLISRK